MTLVQSTLMSSKKIYTISYRLHHIHIRIICYVLRSSSYTLYAEVDYIMVFHSLFQPASPLLAQENLRSSQTALAFGHKLRSATNLPSRDRSQPCHWRLHQSRGRGWPCHWRLHRARPQGPWQMPQVPRPALLADANGGL